MDKTKKPKDIILAAVQQKLAESQPTFDELMRRDPAGLSREELRQMVEHSRRERAVWDHREAKAAEAKARKEGALEGEDAE